MVKSILTSGSFGIFIFIRQQTVFHHLQKRYVIKLLNACKQSCNDMYQMRKISTINYIK